MCCSTLVSQFRLRNEFIKCNFIKRTWREEKKKEKKEGRKVDSCKCEYRGNTDEYWKLVVVLGLDASSISIISMYLE